jgi:phenylpropionate dioxygenase-like ring-hydroxylating dioxygenase large terminal subunit
MEDFGALVDLDRKTVSPRVFVDEAVYRAEQTQIFTHCWLYVAHATQLPNPRDFLTTYMGEEPVIVVRGEDGKIRVFINSCRHRGSRVCRVDHGNNALFVCPYHGWSYDTKGQLRGVPQMDSAYHGELDKSQWGLVEVPRVEIFRDLVFANFDANAITLDDYLGDFRWYLDLVLNRSVNGMTCMPGTHRWRLGGNWKLAAEQFLGDNYHTSTLHRSMLMIGLGPTDGDFRGDSPWEKDFEVKCANGHGWINFDIPAPPMPPAAAAFFARVREESKQTLNPEQQKLVHHAQVGTVFPNFSILSFLGFTSIRVWQPMGTRQMHAWAWGLIEKDAPPEVVDFVRQTQVLTFSPSGIYEQDDGIVWQSAVDAMGGVVRRNHPLNYQQGAGHGRLMDNKPGLIHPPSTEIGVFGFYEFWRDMMTREAK